jgi:hypothetical protein
MSSPVDALTVSRPAYGKQDKRRNYEVNILTPDL